MTDFTTSIVRSLERDKWEVENHPDDNSRLRIVRSDGRLSVSECGHVYVKHPGAHHDPDRWFELTGKERRAIRKAMRVKLRQIVSEIAIAAPTEEGK